MPAHTLNLFRTADQIAMWQFLIEMALNRVGKSGSNVHSVAQYGNRVQFVMTRSDVVDYLVYYYAFCVAKKKAISPELQFFVGTRQARESNIIVECRELEPLFGATIFKILDNSWTDYSVVHRGFNPLIWTTEYVPDHRGVRREVQMRMHALFLKEYIALKFRAPYPHVFKELETAVPQLKTLFPNYEPYLTWRNNELVTNWQMYYVPFDVCYVTRLRLDSGIMYVYNEKVKKVQIAIPYWLLWRVVLEYEILESPMQIIESDQSIQQMYQAVVDKGLTPQMIFNY